MKVSQLIVVLQAQQEKYGDLEIHFGGGIEHEIANVKCVEAKTAVMPGQITGPHLSQPKRLVITGHSIE